MLLMDHHRSIDALEQELGALEAEIADRRLRQAELIHQLDQRLVHRVDGARSIQEWTRARLDVSTHTARDLVDLARALPHQSEVISDCDGLSYERLVATSRLSSAGADDETIRRSFGFDLAGVNRLRSRHRRLTRNTERDAFVDRSVYFQDSLDMTAGRITGELPGFEYTIVRDAVEKRADRFGDLPGPIQNAPQRRADALVSICQDSREGLPGDHAGSEPLTTVFVDADKASSRGEMGAEIEFGPRVGPDVLDRILCEGRVQLVGVSNGKPVATSDGTRAIPPAMRQFVK